MSRWARLCLTVGLTALPATSSIAMDITVCGQTVPDGVRAILTADITCPGSGPAITLGHRARLRLDGHTVSGGTNGVECLSTCRVTGPGAVTGALTGIQTSAGGRIVVKEVDVSGNTVYGIQLLSDPSDQPGRGRLTAIDVTANGNGDAGVVAFPSPRGRNITANGNAGYGVFTCDFSAKNLQATNNGEEGIVGCGGKLVASTVTGNDAAGAGIDVLTVGLPKLSTSNCGKSAMLLGVRRGRRDRRSDLGRLRRRLKARYAATRSGAAPASRPPSD